ncbi:MAG: signal recognition particle-docking protein FtsY [Symbiobacteriaceae bacterium]|nr:signal recognition particle-docking protein FtsY [Symbiobacteriaceae bacterium]
MSFFNRLKEGLVKTKENLMQKIDQVLSNFTRVDEEFFQELEEALIGADVGVHTSEVLLEDLRQKVKQARVEDGNQVRLLLQQSMSELLGEDPAPLNIVPDRLNIVLVVGVNGVGKTTLVGKLAHRYRNQGMRVTIAAADTFRAAAIDQLAVWAERAGAELIQHQDGADPAAVVFDAISAAKARGSSLLLVDTAGRLHNKKHLMEEMGKIFRIIKREGEDAPHEVLLVLDATTGQNAISQAQSFSDVCAVSALALTKLDGTAKGGIVLAIAEQLKLPVKLIGIGEKVDDLRDFIPQEFVAALFEQGS